MSYSQRRRNGRNQRQPHTPITSVATKALAAYGAYKLASWAWSKLSNVNDNDKDNDNDPSESIGIGVTANPNQRHPSSHSRAVSRKRPSQLQKCSRETLCTLSTFLNTLKTTLESHTDFSKQTKLLKQMRSGQNQNGNGNGEGDDSRSHPHPTRTRTKQELWDEIKTKSITRMIATAYAHSILMLLLTVQIHLLGGRIFREQLKLNVSDEHTNTSSGESEAEAAAESGEGSQENDETETNRKEGAINIGASHKQVLLQTYEYFFQHGIKSLVKDVQLVVEVNLSDWKVLQGSEDDESGKSECVGSITLEQFDDGMQRIRTLLDDGLSLENYLRGLESESEPESVSVSVSESESDLQQNEEVRLILDETLDILESPVFETAKKDVVNATFDVLRKDGYAPLFGPEGTAKEPQPLASIVTKLKKVVQGFYNSPDGSTEDRWTERPMSSYPNVYLYHLNRVNSVKELGDVSFN